MFDYSIATALHHLKITTFDKTNKQTIMLDVYIHVFYTNIIFVTELVCKLYYSCILQ